MLSHFGGIIQEYTLYCTIKGLFVLSTKESVPYRLMNIVLLQNGKNYTCSYRRWNQDIWKYSIRFLYTRHLSSDFPWGFHYWWLLHLYLWLLPAQVLCKQPVLQWFPSDYRRLAPRCRRWTLQPCPLMGNSRRRDELRKLIKSSHESGHVDNPDTNLMVHSFTIWYLLTVQWLDF